MIGSYRWLLLFPLLVGVFAIPAILAGPSPAVPDETLPQAKQEWPLKFGNAGQSSYSALDQINAQNVKTLGAAWVSTKFPDGASSRVTPLVHDGRMILSAGARVFALDPKTGKEIWSYMTASVSGPQNGRGSGIGVPSSQGVAIGDGLVFVGLMNCNAIALDEKTGKLVWSQQLNAYMPRKGQGLSAAPTYAAGVVFWSVTNNERYVGHAVALDAKDGHELWHFEVVPGPGEPGHETWAQDTDAWKTGGGNIWLPPAVDPELGLVYYGTGNADPIHGGEIRPGNNLYTCSVIAIDIKTGKLRWYFQTTHHDLWEHDLGTPLVLYDMEMGGRMRKGLAAMRKDGHLFLLDRETGKPLLPVTERPEPQDARDKTAPTQPYPVGDSIIEPCPDYWKGKIPAGFDLECTFTPPSVDKPNLIQPEIGVIYEPISFNPVTGYFYVQGRTDLMSNRRAEDPYYGDMNFGLVTTRAPGIHKYDLYEIGAIDARTDKIVWKKILPPLANFGTGGWLSTAGGLACHRMVDGNLNCYDAKGGDLLWQFQTGSNGGDDTPMSYEVDGKQYIAMVSGSVVWAFALGGTVPPAAAPPPPAPFPDIQGPIQNTDAIHTASLVQDEFNERWRVDEWSFDPYRARVAVGAPVTFTNNGDQTHTIEAVDGSWTTGPMQPDDRVVLTFDKPGDYLYHRKEHPWSYGELIVVDKSELPDDTAGPGQGGGRGGGGRGGRGAAQVQGAPGTFAGQAARGKTAYMQSCSLCHGQEMNGNEQIPALVGEAFVMRWQGRSAGDLFDKTRTTMPTGMPGSLDASTYLDLVAYMLQVNDFRAGGAALQADTLANSTLTKR